jgi:trk system potassium uptake protein TrkH
MIVCGVTGPFWTLLEGFERSHDRGGILGLLSSGLVTMAIGGALLWFGRRASGLPLGRREAILVVALIWLACGILGGLPYVLDAGMHPADAFFEAVSGFTTTGATVVGNIEGTLSRPLLLWRSLTHWLGGMGIVVLFVAVFPNIGVGGKHLYRSEVPGPVAEGLRPRIASTGLTLWRIYALFTIVLIVLLKLFGMSWFEAICHAFACMSTGGFSTLDASIGGFNADRVGWWGSLGIELTMGVFMLIAGANFAIYSDVFRGGGLRSFWRSSEFLAYLGIVAIAVVAIFASSWAVDPTLASALPKLREAFFLTATTITSTGFGTTGYVTLPPFALTVMLLLMVVGGCSGSTAGGMKVSRIVLLAKVAWSQIRKSFRPQVVHVVRLDRKPVDPTVILDVGGFFLIFVATLAIGILIVTATDDVSVPRAFGATLSAVSNMGPGPFFNVGPAAYLDQPVDNFAAYSPFAKLVFAVVMILGRLEFYTLLALFLPDFWRR